MPSFLRASVALSLYAAFFLLCSTSAYSQKTINVPADQPTIQDAINAASNGDTVLVAPGTYSENINFSGKAITLTSSGGAAATIIDGGQKAPVVTFMSGETLSSVLNGFTIQNGMSNGNSGYAAGGIHISSASPTVTNNIVQNNAGCNGGGMTVDFSSARVQGNTIENNNTKVCSGGDGAGIEVGGAGSAQIIGNVIQNNSGLGANGGGITLFAAGTPTISGNLISGNTVQGLSPATQGGGIWIVNQSDALIVQNVIFNNTAGQGSGIYFGVPSGDRGPILVNNTIVGGSGSPQGSAVYASGFDNLVQFSNNVLIGAAGQNAVYCDGTYQSVPPTFTNNDGYSPNGTGFGGTCAAAAGQNGNISVDPLFVNAASDFHLQPSSPAIDAGTNSAPNLPQTDFDGKPRIIDGNNDCISTVDMGAYELQRAASMSLSASSLSFGNQVIGTSSTAQPVTLSNAGNTCFQFSSAGTSGDFSEGNNCPAGGLMGGTSCVYSVTFTPTAAGPRSGALAINGTDGVKSSALSASLSGYGITSTSPVVSLSPGSLTFNSQVVNTASSPQSITLTNIGNAALAISSISVYGTFLQSNNCPASLAPTLSCTISVIFKPRKAVYQGGYVKITDNASGSPQTPRLSGMGLDFALAVSPTSATITHGQAGSFILKVTSLGAAFNSSVSLSCSGLPSSATCGLSPASLVPGKTGASSTLMISTSGQIPLGTYNVVISGISGSDSHSTTFVLTVN